MRVYKKMILVAMLVVIAISFSSCMTKETIHIISGSENKTLEPLIEKFERKEHINVEMHYKGSLDIMSMLSTSEINEYDAVWPANSIWISLGDEDRIIKHTQSIMTSPVVFGIEKSKAESLGFADAEVGVSDFLQAVKNDELSFIMTSATQSNSGATGYLGFLHALSKNESTLSLEDLESQDLKDDVISLLSGVNRSSGSSGWLKDLYLSSDKYSAMINYEALIIEANEELIQQGREPLYCIYPYDGLGIADSPLGYVDKGDDSKEKAFLELQEYLLSQDVQDELLKYGRRTGVGNSMDNASKKVFKPEWGIDIDQSLSYIRMPNADVIYEALKLYQTEFKKPSNTVYCLDFSGSMYGDGEYQLKQAMETILTPEIAAQYLLQNSSKDKTAIVIFNHEVIGITTSEGENTEVLYDELANYEATGGTDIYFAAYTAIEHLIDQDLNGCFPAVVLMTDGRSDRGNRKEFNSYYKGIDQDIPIFSIMFGEAEEDQLEELAEMSSGRVFDGTHDLISAFKKARGYN